jgi:ribose transport system permease protein
VRKALGLTGLLTALVALTCAWEVFQGEGLIFLTPANLRNLLTWVGLFGILSLAQSIVIITGGIDLSIGSVVMLVGIVLAMLLGAGDGWPIWMALPVALALAAAIGAWHGSLVAWLNIQPFIVTLCSLFIFRGLGRVTTGDRSLGFGYQQYPTLDWLSRGTLGDLVPDGFFLKSALNMFPAPFLVLLILAVIFGAYLHFAPQGRHIFALGANEDAARFSGIRTKRLKFLAYVICSVVTGFGGILLAFKTSSIAPSSFGSFYELYAIAGAVLGGCSLRGGAGNVLGVVIGASLIVVLRNLVNILGIPSQLEYVVIGGAILLGVAVDELLDRRRRAATHRVEA